MFLRRLNPMMRITSREKQKEGSIEKDKEKMQLQCIYYAISLSFSLYLEDKNNIFMLRSIWGRRKIPGL